jgi:hypothetical protein
VTSIDLHAWYETPLGLAIVPAMLTVMYGWRAGSSQVGMRLANPSARIMHVRLVRRGPHFHLGGQVPELTTPHVWVEMVQFLSGATLKAESREVIVVVGPNNSGKSALLRGILAKAQTAQRETPPIARVKFGFSGSVDDLHAWLLRIARRAPAMAQVRMRA